MEIYHYRRRDQQGNFGDELNTWLWQRLLPPSALEAEDAVLVGLGTLLNHLLPQRLGQPGRVFVFSTGAGYEKPLRSLPSHWHLYCVRGPLTAQRLELPADLAVTDGAVLLRRLVSSEVPKTAPAALMLHVHHASFATPVWQAACEALGIRYIDPRWPLERVITAIQSSALLIAEAMHGAIAADALGVPWIPITTSPRILSFKWQDWCASIREPYRPAYLPPLTEHYPRYGRGVRSGARAALHWGQSAVQGHWRAVSQIQVEQRLGHILKHKKPTLSDRDRLESLTQILEQKLLRLGQDAVAV